MRCCARTRGAPSGGGARKRPRPATRCTRRRRSGRRCWWPTPARPASPSRSPGRAPTCCTHAGSPVQLLPRGRPAGRAVARRAARAVHRQHLRRRRCARQRRRVRRRAAWRRRCRCRACSYGVLALGDRTYANFCGFGRRLDGWLRTQGVDAAVRAHRRRQRRHAALRDWQHRLGRLAGTSDLPEWQAPAFEAWRLVARRLLNPGSGGAPVCQLDLQPRPGVPLPNWEAGDLVQVLAPGERDTAARILDRIVARRRPHAAAGAAGAPRRRHAGAGVGLADRASSTSAARSSCACARTALSHRRQRRAPAGPDRQRHRLAGLRSHCARAPRPPRARRAGWCSASARRRTTATRPTRSTPGWPAACWPTPTWCSRATSPSAATCRTGCASGPRCCAAGSTTARRSTCAAA